MSDKVPFFRLSFRAEGDWVNAYFARPESMEDRILLGSLRVMYCELPGIFDDWKALIIKIVSIACEKVIGEVPSEWNEVTAPEHERSGRA